MSAVRAAYREFVLIGSGNRPEVVQFQRRLFETTPGIVDESVVANNFIDLSSIPEVKHRNGIVGNAVLFCIARLGGKQVVQSFLRALYAKWLENPVFGQDTPVMAKKRIASFGNYLRSSFSEKEITTIIDEALAD
jgi:hypothetical protein